MTLWVCNNCGTLFAVGMRMCPQCTSENAREAEDADMAKITRHGGPSDLNQAPAEAIPNPEGPNANYTVGTDPASDVEPDQAKTAAAAADMAEGGDQWDSGSYTTSSGQEQPSEPSSSLSDPSLVPATESLSGTTETGSDGAGSADGANSDQQDDYDDWTNSELSKELENRALPKSGTKAELVERLRANDAEQEQERNQ